MLPGTLVLPMLLLLLGVLGSLGVVVLVVVGGLPMVTMEGVAGLALPKPPCAWTFCETVSASMDTAISGAARARREDKGWVVNMGRLLGWMAVAVAPPCLPC